MTHAHVFAPTLLRSHDNPPAVTVTEKLKTQNPLRVTIGQLRLKRNRRSVATIGQVVSVVWPRARWRACV
eukprot:7154351-Pyramimonas_sp.AAC.1